MTTAARLDTLRRSYERSAATYDENFRDVQYVKFRAMLGGAELGPAPWLDLGCGTGLLQEYLRETRGSAARSVVGVDFSAAMLARAKARGVRAACAPLDALPFRDAAFSAVFSFTVLRIVRDDDGERRALAEVARVLTPGGRFFFTVLRTKADPSLAVRLVAAGLRPEPARSCGQDVGYRGVRV
jgi:ubiquinone/menaquinone biosynthesis C-methylase UbiE